MNRGDYVLGCAELIRMPLQAETILPPAADDARETVERLAADSEPMLSSERDTRDTEPSQASDTEPCPPWWV